MESNSCDTCALRARYDKNPKSFIGRLWKWHIRFCPGWKRYMESLDEENSRLIIEKYKLKVK